MPSVKTIIPVSIALESFYQGLISASLVKKGNQEMQSIIFQLKTPADCLQLAANVKGRRPRLALAALHRAVRLEAATHHATTKVERKGFEALHAFEMAKSTKFKKYRASRTRSMIARYGIIQTIERIVSRNRASEAFISLEEMGMLYHSYETLVLRHSQFFSSKAISRSNSRLAAAGNLRGRQNFGSARREMSSSISDKKVNAR